MSNIYDVKLRKHIEQLFNLFVVINAAEYVTALLCCYAGDGVIAIYHGIDCRSVTVPLESC